MFENIYKLFEKELSGNNALDIVKGISNYHRIQSSPGFRQAALFCKEKIEGYKIPIVNILEFPATGKKTFWNCPIPKEWVINSATLEIVEPEDQSEILCRFFENPCSIIQRSGATPSEGLTAEIVILPKNLSTEEMKKYDLKGKFILTNDQDLLKLRKIAVGQLGAIGIIYDHVSELPPIRSRSNFPTATRYTSFWYGTKGEEGDALGFVLSASQGDKLRSLIKENNQEIKEAKEKDKKPPKKLRLKATIDAEFYDGKMEVVEFLIPGKMKNQEVLAVAHLCHPKPGALDNASGCATLIEVARTIQHLISENKIPQPTRSIRFLLMAEYTGTYCFLSQNEKELNKWVGGINLDMVGADQSIGGGRTLILERTHNANPSYVNDLLAIIFEKATKQVSNLGKTNAYAMFAYARDQPFSGGSDHHLLGDPQVNIPSPMLIQWPDKYYHSSEDTCEKLSPDMLKIVGKITATYCYFLANLSDDELFWLANEIVTRGKIRVTNRSQKIIKSVTDYLGNKEKTKQEKTQFIAEILGRIEQEYSYNQDLELQTLESLRNLANSKTEQNAVQEVLEQYENNLAISVDQETQYIKNFIHHFSEQKGISLKNQEKKHQKMKGEDLIPKRIMKGPITSLFLLDLSYQQRKELKSIEDQFSKMKHTFQSALFWIDDKRSIGEIANLIQNEHKKSSVEFLIKMLKKYEEFGLLKLEKKDKEG
jgi:hypothetical protein